MHRFTQHTITCSKSKVETLDRARCEICSKLTIKTPERRYVVFIVNLEHISHLAYSVSIVDFEQVIIGWIISMIYRHGRN